MSVQLIMGVVIKTVRIMSEVFCVAVDKAIFWIGMASTVLVSYTVITYKRCKCILFKYLNHARY